VPAGTEHADLERQRRCDRLVRMAAYGGIWDARSGGQECVL